MSRAPRIAICDYGIGNLGSVLKAFRQVGVPAFLASDPADLREADALVLPGDGAFAASMAELVARGQDEMVRRFVAEERPVLGICIGMQLLFEESDEHGVHQGLGLLRGRVERLPATVRVPHMGWNVLARRRPHEVLQDLRGGEYVYFVHSYACRPADDVVLATTDYGGPVAAVVGRGSLIGMQFHPEKSQSVGLRLVARFAEIAIRAAAPVLAAGGER